MVCLQVLHFVVRKDEGEEEEFVHSNRKVLRTYYVIYKIQYGASEINKYFVLKTNLSMYLEELDGQVRGH